MTFSEFLVFYFVVNVKITVMTSLIVTYFFKAYLGRFTRIGIFIAAPAK